MKKYMHKFMDILLKETELKYKVDEHEENINFVWKADTRSKKEKSEHSSIKKT